MPLQQIHKNPKAVLFLAGHRLRNFKKLGLPDCDCDFNPGLESRLGGLCLRTPGYRWLTSIILDIKLSFNPDINRSFYQEGSKAQTADGLMPSLGANQPLPQTIHLLAHRNANAVGHNYISTAECSKICDIV